MKGSPRDKINGSSEEVGEFVRQLFDLPAQSVAGHNHVDQVYIAVGASRAAGE